MRATPIPLLALVALFTACPRPVPTHLPSPAHPLSPAPSGPVAAPRSAAAADLPRRVPVAPVAPGDLPRVFAEGRERDVDQDGLLDRVREVALLPRSSPDATLPAAVLVAHALPDGRFALDDDVTRASLRALCPEDPPLTYRPAEREDPFERAERLNALLLDAYCQQAWGRDLAAVAAALRSLPGTVGVDALRADQVDAIVQVLREFASPITLEPLRAATLPAFPEREPPPSGAPSPEEPAVAPACQRVVADNARAVAQANAIGAHVPQGEGENGALRVQYVDDSQCAARGDEVWAIRLSRPRAQSGALVLAATLSHDRAGARTSQRMEPFSYRELSHRWATIAAVFDWDGDGSLEAVVRSHGWDHEASGSGAVRVFTARGGAVVPYAPAARLTGIVRVHDDDGDGRLDLVLQSPWHVVESCGPGDNEVAGPELLAHALPDGTFSTDDAVARAHVARLCEEALRVGVYDLGDSYSDLLAAACARRAGAGAEATVAALRARHRDAPRLRFASYRGSECTVFQGLALNAVIAR